MGDEKGTVSVSRCRYRILPTTSRGRRSVANEQVEREHKYSAAEQYRLPDLDAVLPPGGRVEQATVALDSVYFDTEEHDLLAHGVTLRRRTGEIDNGWHLKVPSGDTRTEIRLELEADDDAVPEELATLTIGLRRGKPLRHIVTIRTSRTAHRLLDADGRVIVEVADDHVDAVAPGRGSATLNSWREIEAELGATGTIEDLDTVDARLIESGLQAAVSPNKVATALGATSRETEATDRTDADHTAGEVIRDYLRQQDDALVAGDLSLRRGLGAIHPTRVATRRLRSTLRIFADYFDADRAKKLDVELSWYAELLGQVRDREVQRARFAEAVGALPDELVLGPVAAGIEQYLLSEQLQHQAALDEAMTSPRYLALLQETSLGQRTRRSPHWRAMCPRSCANRSGSPHERSTNTSRPAFPVRTTPNCTKPVKRVSGPATPPNSLMTCSARKPARM